MKRTLFLSTLVLAGSMQLSAQDRYDLNKDKAVNVGDVTTLVNVILGKTEVAEYGVGWSSPGLTADGKLRADVTDAAGNAIARIVGRDNGKTVDVEEDGGISRIGAYDWEAPNKFVRDHGEGKKEVVTYTVSSAGLITQIKEVTTLEAQNKVLTETVSDYTYDAQGHLKSITTKGDYSGDYGFTFIWETTETYTWNAAGDLTRIESKSKSNMDDAPTTQIYELQYGSAENPLLRMPVLHRLNADSYKSVMMELGFFGMGPQRLPTKLKTPDDTWSYAITLRSDGTFEEENVGGWLTYAPLYEADPEPAPDGSFGDLNKDGDVNVGDVTTLVNRILGKLLDDPDKVDPQMNAIVRDASGKALKLGGDYRFVVEAYGEAVRVDKDYNILQIGHLGLKEPTVFQKQTADGTKQCSYFFCDEEDRHLISSIYDEVADGKGSYRYSYFYTYDNALRLSQLKINGTDNNDPTADYNRTYEFTYSADGLLEQIDLTGWDFHGEATSYTVTRRYVFSGSSQANPLRRYLPMNFIPASPNPVFETLGILGNGPDKLPAQVKIYKTDDMDNYEFVEERALTWKLDADGLVVGDGGTGTGHTVSYGKCPSGYTPAN